MKTPPPSKRFLSRLLLVLMLLALLSLACFELAEIEAALEEELTAQEIIAEEAEGFAESVPPTDEPALPVDPPSEASEASEPAEESVDIVEIPASLYPPGDFDFLVMSLSWSPDYCATSGQDDAQQCSIGRRLAFVLHGLWPQYEDGWPQYCTDEELPYGIEEEYPNLFPSDKLYDHEWEKHGTCSGLSPEGYFDLSALIKASIAIPPAYQSPEETFRTTVEDLQGAFVQTNPDFDPETVAVRCSGSGRYLKELFICFEKDGAPRPCSDEILRNAARSCQQDSFLVRNIR
jgi:ribonuclease T2